MQKQIYHKKQNNKFVKWISNLSAYTKNKTINALIFALAFFIIGGTNYCLMFGIFVPTFFILDFFIIILLLSPIFFFKKTMFDRIYLPIIIFLITTAYTVNTLFHDYFGSIFPLKDFIWAIRNAVQVVLNAGSLNWGWAGLNIALAIVFSLGIILYNALWRFQESSNELKIRGHRKVAFALSLMFGSIVCFESSLQIWCAVQRKNKIDDIDYVNYAPDKHCSELGMIGYYIQETRQMMSDKGETVSTIKNYFNNGSYLEDDFTGLLGGESPANVMVIVLETGDSTIINPDYDSEKIMPHLNKFLSSGVWCNKNYSYNHTNITDAITITGNYPQVHYFDWLTTKTPFSLPSILGDRYQKYFAHDLAKCNDSYNRMKSLKGLGFDECWYHNEILPEEEPWQYKWSNYTQDTKFINKLLEKIDNFQEEKPFYLHYLTVHMHMDQIITPQNKAVYEEEEREYGQYLKEPYWKNPFKPNSIEGKKYRNLTLKAMDFDTGLGKIWEKLYNSNNSYLENTLLVVCADHSWYEKGSHRQQLGPASRHINDINNIKGYSTILGFYHPLLEEKFGQIKPDHKFDKPTWPSVVVPTILDLLGETYNPRFYLNKSIFDESYDENELFYSFWNYRFMNEKFTSWDHYNISNNYGGNKQEAAEFKRRMEEARWQLRIIDSLYMKKIFNKYDYKDFMPKEQ